jgi:hypothetical protein
MVQFARGVLKRGLQIFSIEIRHFLQNLLSIQPSRKEVQNINYAYSHPANTRAAAALVGVDGYSVE